MYFDNIFGKTSRNGTAGLKGMYIFKNFTRHFQNSLQKYCLSLHSQQQQGACLPVLSPTLGKRVLKKLTT